MAGVIAYVLGSFSAVSQIQRPNTLENVGAELFFACTPASGSKWLTPWYVVGSASASSYPFPFFVTTWSTIGPRCVFRF